MAMATDWEICLKLGFIDGTKHTRGSSSILVHEIEEFVKSWDMWDARADTSEYVYDIYQMTNWYLYSKGAGKQNWGNHLSNGYYNFLEWPKDSAQ